MKKKLIFPCLAFISLSTLTGCNPGTPSGPTYYTVTFDSQGGSEIPSQSVVEGGYATKPTNPTRGDDVFNCWVLNPKSMEEFKFETTPINNNITLYAHYFSDYHIDGKFNVDYNDVNQQKFTVKDKQGNEASGFKYKLYFPGYERLYLAINEDTGQLDIYNGNGGDTYEGYVYAYKEVEGKVTELCYKQFRLGSFDCLDFTKIENAEDEYSVKFKSTYTTDVKENFKISIPEYIKDEQGNITGKVTKVENEAFNTFLNDKDRYGTFIYLADSITDIGDNAFYGREGSGAKIWNMPKAIKHIGKNAFRNCSGSSNSDYNIFDLSNTKIETIDDYAFHYSGGMLNKKIVFPSTIKLIGQNALASKNVPDSITFKDSTGWVSCNLGTQSIVDVYNPKKNVEYISTIGGNLTYGIEKLTVNVDALKYELSNNTAKVVGVDMSKVEKTKGHMEINQRAVTVPEKIIKDDKEYIVTEVADGAFDATVNEDVKELENVYLPESITKIGDKAFKGCIKLRSIYIPQNVTELGEEMFDNCHSIRSMKVHPNNKKFRSINTLSSPHEGNVIYELDSRGDCGILRYGCSALTSYGSYSIPATVTKISDHAFYGIYNSSESTSGLKNIGIPKTVTYIGKNAFYHAFNENGIGKGDNYQVSFTATERLWTLNNGNDTIHGFRTNLGKENIINLNYSSADATIGYADYAWSFNGTGSTGLKYTNTEEEGVRCSTVYKGDCTDTDVMIPEMNGAYKVTKIGIDAFNGDTNLKSISLGANITNIMEYAFKGCTSLEEIVIPASCNELGYKANTSFHASVFEGCTNLKKVYFEGLGLNGKFEYGYYSLELIEPGKFGYVWYRLGEISNAELRDPAANAEKLKKVSQPDPAATPCGYYVWRRLAS